MQAIFLKTFRTDQIIMEGVGFMKHLHLTNLHFLTSEATNAFSSQKVQPNKV